MLFILLFVTCIFLAVINYVTNNRNYWTNRGIVQVNGVMSTFFTNPYSIPETYKYLYNKYPKEKYIGIFISKPALIVKDFQDVQTVLQADFNTFRGRGLVSNPKDLLADNILFINDYQRWKLIRQTISPVFTSRKLKNMFYIMNDCARNFVNQIGKFDHEKYNIYDLLYAYNASCITATIFSIDTTSNIMNSPFLDMTKKSIGPTFKINLKLFVCNMMPKLQKFINLKFFSEHETFFFGAVRKVIEARRNDKKLRHDFIDTCIKLQRLGKMRDQTTGYELEPSVEVLGAQAFFIFLAGTSTATTGIHFTLLELASNPLILKRLCTEIDEIFDKSNNNLTFDDIDKMVYLDMVINESMRKYPPIGSIQRVCTQDTSLPVGRMTLKKGEIVILPIFALHRNEDYFPKPEIFDPERFSPENIHRIIKFTYLPFGEGTRMCLGSRYARLQMKAGLSWLLRKYSLKEQKYNPKSFDKSFFEIKDTKVKIELIPRNISV